MAEQRIRGTRRAVLRFEPNTAAHPKRDDVSLDTLALECGHILFVPSAASPRQAMAQGLKVYMMCPQCGPEQPEEPERAPYTPPPVGVKEDVI